MTRECHVRFWERAGVRFPRATRQTYIKVRGRWKCVDAPCDARKIITYDLGTVIGC
jgi:hypothetical protein